jgi:acyl-CoA synthetase (AMP-forming)/AMP-acid ligase II
MAEPAVVDLRSVAPPPASPVPAEFLDEAGTLSGAFSRLVERFPDFECLTILDRERRERRHTLGSLGAGARAVAGALSRLRLPRGRVVVIALPTGPELVAAYFGTLLAGGVPALVSTPLHRVADRSRYRERLAAILRNAEAPVLYCGAAVAELVRGDGAELAGAALLTPAEAAAAGAPLAPCAPEPSDVATVQYSSGSTGTPNGVLLSHRAILNNLRAIREALRLRPGDVSVNWIPLYHDMGLIDGFLLPLLSGCPTVLIPTLDFMQEPSLWLWAIHRYRGALSWAPNFAYSLCAKRLSERDLVGLDLGGWRIAISASEPILAETLEAFASRFERFGFRREAFTPFYGLAENVTAVTAHPVEEPPRVDRLDREALAAQEVARPASGAGIACVGVGRCLPRCRVEIRDAQGQALPERRVGKIWIRSDCLFEGYRGQPELTARTLVDGWLDSGDRGYLAGDDLFFVAREKDLIVIGGEKLAPHDVESVVNEVPGVRSGCAVAFGVANPARGTEEVAVVAETKEEGAEARARLESAIRARALAALGLAVRHILLVPPGGVEKTTSGKLARRATRARYADRLQGA